MTHTPGPWIYSSKGYVCGGECCVADTETYSATKKLSPAQRIANAKLIAAAPDLLEACMYLLGNAEAAEWGDYMLESAKAAVKKATGGAL